MYSLRKLKHTAWYLNIWIQSDETSKVHINLAIIILFAIQTFHRKLLIQGSLLVRVPGNSVIGSHITEDPKPRPQYCTENAMVGEKLIKAQI